VGCQIGICQISGRERYRGNLKGEKPTHFVSESWHREARIGCGVPKLRPYLTEPPTTWAIEQQAREIDDILPPYSAVSICLTASPQPD